MSVQITKNDFLQYKEVQKSGLFNMYSPRAREMTNLSEEQWSRIMKEYTKLNEAWGKDD